jgi:hypothetical protein
MAKALAFGQFPKLKNIVGSEWLQENDVLHAGVVKRYNSAIFLVLNQTPKV